MTEFNEWESFYLIVGGAAGALIGLQFVVLTLFAQRPQTTEPDAGHAFSTPTVVNFSVVLFVAAVLRMPWQKVFWPGIMWGIIGLLGVLYSASVVRRMTTQTTYKPEFIDWLTYAILPAIGYAALMFSAIFIRGRLRESLFVVAAASLLFLFTGIYNAWDAVTYHVFEEVAGHRTQRRK
jgi:hypothetical protein